MSIKKAGIKAEYRQGGNRISNKATKSKKRDRTFFYFVLQLVAYPVLILSLSCLFLGLLPPSLYDPHRLLLYISKCPLGSQNFKPAAPLPFI